MATLSIIIHSTPSIHSQSRVNDGDSMAQISCVGLACLDYLFRVSKLPSGGGKSFAEDYKAAPGGPAAAAGIAVASLGHDATFIGRLGDDQAGRDVVRYLAGRSVDTSRIRMIAGETSQVSSVVIDQTGERQVINYSSSSLDASPEWIPEEAIKNSDFVLFLLLLQTPLYMLHETEEYIFPGGFGKFFNMDIMKFKTPDKPLALIESFVFAQV